MSMGYCSAMGATRHGAEGQANQFKVACPIYVLHYIFLAFTGKKYIAQYLVGVLSYATYNTNGEIPLIFYIFLIIYIFYSSLTI